MISAEIDEYIFKKYILDNEQFVGLLTFVKDSKGNILKVIIGHPTITVKVK